MANNILEVGYGYSGRSAVLSGGEVFEYPDTVYFGTDIPQKINSIGSPDHLDQIRPTEAHWAALPYIDSAFGAVVMRNCFGQFLDTPKLWVSQCWSLGPALGEVARVLKPGGKLFISEENTPDDLSHVVPIVLEAGFDIETIEKEVDIDSKEANPGYPPLRKQFFGDELGGFAGDGFLFNYRYVISAFKPSDREFTSGYFDASHALQYRADYTDEWRAAEDGTVLKTLIPEDSETAEGNLRIARGLVRHLGDTYKDYLAQLESEQNSST